MIPMARRTKEKQVWIGSWGETDKELKDNAMEFNSADDAAAYVLDALGLDADSHQEFVAEGREELDDGTIMLIVDKEFNLVRGDVEEKHKGNGGTRGMSMRKEMMQFLRKDMEEPLETAQAARDAAKDCRSDLLAHFAFRLGSRLATRRASLKEMKEKGNISDSEFKELSGILDNILVTYSEAESLFINGCECKKK